MRNRTAYDRGRSRTSAGLAAFLSKLSFLGLLSLIGISQLAAGSGARDVDRLADAETLRLHWQHSARAYTVLTRVEPENGQAWFRLGQALYHTGDYARAIDAFERAERLDFRPLAVRYHLAATHELLGDHERADRWLKRARSLESSSEPGSASDRELLPHLRRDPRLAFLLSRDEDAHRVRSPDRPEGRDPSLGRTPRLRLQE